MKGLVVVMCIVVLTLAVWNNALYKRVNQESERIEKEKDSICLMRYENLLYTIQTNGQAIDSLVQEHRSADSAYIKDQEHLLQQMGIMISIDKQILKEIQKLRCSILSTIHTAE